MMSERTQTRKSLTAYKVVNVEHEDQSGYDVEAWLTTIK